LEAFMREERTTRQTGRGRKGDSISNGILGRDIWSKTYDRRGGKSTQKMSG